MPNIVINDFVLILSSQHEEILQALEPEFSTLKTYTGPTAVWPDLAQKLLQQLPRILADQAPFPEAGFQEQVQQLLILGASAEAIARLGDRLAHLATLITIREMSIEGAAALQLLEQVQAAITRCLGLPHLDLGFLFRDDQRALMATMGHMKVAVFRSRADSRLVSVNQAGADILGAATPAELIGRPFAQFYASEEDRAALRKGLKETGQVIGWRVRSRRLDGQIIWLETNLLAHFAPSGEMESIEGFGMDVTTLVAAEEEIRKLNQFLGVVIDNANVWLNVLDQNAKVVIWNKAAESISGYGRNEVIGHGDIWNWLYPDPQYRQEITTKAAQIIQGEEVENFETTIQTKTGEQRTIAWHSRHLTDEQGHPLGSVALGRDITPEKALQQQLLQQERRIIDTLEKLVLERTAELEQANRELKLHDLIKDRFLANISHELRTPLVSGLGYVGLILEGGMGPLSEKAQKGLRISQRNLKKLEELIDNLLTFTQKDVDQRLLAPVTFDFSKLVEDCIIDLRGNVTKQLNVAVEIEPDLPEVIADREQIRRVLSNILTNAEKFTGPQAEIIINARKIAAERAVVRISDNGIGIPQYEHELVFNRLYRSSRTNSNAYRGTGIGLSLVKEILQNHNCTVKAEDRDIQGTTITFTLPLAPPGEKK